jgi:hypothetical protein
MKYTYDTEGRLTSILAPKEVSISRYTLQYSYLLTFLFVKQIILIKFRLLRLQFNQDN